MMMFGYDFHAVEVTVSPNRRRHPLTGVDHKTTYTVLNNEKPNSVVVKCR